MTYGSGDKTSQQGSGCGAGVIALVGARDQACAVNDDKGGLLVDRLHAEGFQQIAFPVRQDDDVRSRVAALGQPGAAP